MHFNFRFQNPNKHFIEISTEIIIKDLKPFTLELATWRPGRYEKQNYAKNIVFFQIYDKYKNPIPFKKLNTNQWEISPIKLDIIFISYFYYAKEPNAGGSWFKHDLIYINFINLLLYNPQNYLTEPCSVDLYFNQNYEFDTALKFIKYDNKLTLFSNSFLELADSPFLAAQKLIKIIFNINSTQFCLTFFGNINPNLSKISSDFEAFILEQMYLFESFPEYYYHFQFIIPPFEKYHGVEHSKGTVIVLGPDSEFESYDFYKSLLGISSHELFHAWNICKIRPKNLLPYNFSKAQYFPEGFIVEGVTTYYGDLMLLKSGVWSFDEFAVEFSKSIQNHLHNNAKLTVSLLDSQTDLWTDGYQISHPFRKISIYDKGSIIAFILDIYIRKATQNNGSLNDVLRIMWNNFGKKSIGYNIDDYLKIAENVSGLDLTNYYNNFIAGTVNIIPELNSCFDYLGLKLNLNCSFITHQSKFGLKVNINGIITEISEKSEAYFKLDVGDKILKFNDEFYDFHTFNSFESEILILTIERLGELFSFKLYDSNEVCFPFISISINEFITSEQKENFSDFCVNHKKLMKF